MPHADGFLLQLSRDLVPVVLKRLSMFILRSKVKLADASGQWTQYGVWDADAGESLAVSERDGAISIGIDAGRRLVLAAEGLFAPNAPADDWALAEIRAGRPLIEQPTQDQFVPQMVNLELAGGVDFQQGLLSGAGSGRARAVPRRGQAAHGPPARRGAASRDRSCTATMRPASRAAWW